MYKVWVKMDGNMNKYMWCASHSMHEAFVSVRSGFFFNNPNGLSNPVCTCEFSKLEKIFHVWR